jgi:hypothetical protein
MSSEHDFALLKNLNVSDYTIDELFSMLQINITANSSLTSVQDQIMTNTERLIKEFKSVGKESLVDFFRNVRASLLGSEVDTTLTSSERLLMQYDKSYNPFSKKIVASSSENLYDANAGAGNPINRKTVSKLLNIDSRFRQNYATSTSTNYTIDLNYPINNVIEMKLSDIELPTTYHPINTTNQNNYFWFATYNQEELDANTPKIYYYVVRDANYYFDNLITDINTNIKKINTNDELAGPYAAIPISLSFDLNYNNLGGVGNGTGFVDMGILSSSSTDLSLNMVQQIVQIELNFNAPPIPGVTSSTRVVDPTLIPIYYDTSTVPIQQRFGWMIGYRKPFYTGALNYISESILDVLGPRYLFLILNDYNKSNNVNFLSASKDGMLPDNIIARLSLKGAAFSIQSQNDFSVYAEPRYYYGPVNISRLSIQLVDEFGRNMNLNNNDFSFTLRMTTVYSAT